jgi:NAD(P)-dependent dehydrogenase (short-subunit alcohol dehydrogenase family)
MELDRLNPVTLITGAASGIGAACARLLSRRSEGGLILADFDEDALCKTADSLRQPPERVSTLAFDLADPKRWADAAHFIQGQYGRLDWAIVNAGAPAPQSDLVEWRRDAELDDAFLALRAVTPLMRASAQGGAIVVTASAAALNAPKAGLTQFMRVAAQEATPGIVRVNAIAPGGAATPMWANMPWFQDLVAEHGSEGAALDSLSGMAPPLARLAAAADVARLIMLLLSDASSITGATLVVDGGYTI